MTYPVNVTEPLEAVHRRTIAVLDDLVQKAGELGLAEPPPVVERYRRKLREDTCKVLVAGGAKRGKSTFVNALLGRDVLPTGVAAGQVFNIRPSREEAYRLRFEDGSEREVSPEDLPLYGSRTTRDPFIRWIEVDAPVRFLPHDLSLLDMPGSAPFMDRFVPEADAVIFVLESGRPVNDDNLKLIEEILDATPHIFFIQTKVDLYDEEDWRNVQRLNQEILEKRFEGRLAGARVWPISSTNLRKATTGDGEEASLIASYHRKLAVALRAFLDGVAGWNRVAEALLVATRYHAASREVFSGQLARFADESQQKRSEMQKATVEGKRRFEEDWGPRGHKGRELKERLLAGVQGALPGVMVLGGATYGAFTQAGSLGFDAVCLLGVGGEGVQVAAALVSQMGARGLTLDQQPDLLASRLTAAGAKLAGQLPRSKQDRLMIVMSDAHSPNHQFIIDGLQQVVGKQFPLTGGSVNKNAGQTYLYFRGRLHEDAAIAVMLSGEFAVALSGRRADDNDGIIRTAKESAAEALAKLAGQPIGMLAFNCGGRRGRLDNVADELAAFQSAVGGQLPLFGCYCAGEIGPVDGPDKKPDALCGGSGWHVMVTAIGR